MIRALRGARRRIGHRGAFLVALAALDEAYAALIPSSHDGNWAWLSYVAPLPLWAALWALVGLVLLAGAFAERDWWAFSTAIFIKMLWATTEFIGLIRGAVHGWTSVAIWAWAATVVLIIASRPERQWPSA